MQSNTTYRNYLPYILFFLLIVLCYGVTLWNGYSFDDLFITENSNVLQGIHGIKKIWQSPFIITDSGMKIDYRPIPLSFYAIEYHFFGKNPMISHLVSIIFYAINVCLLYLVCIRVFELNKIHTYLPILIVVFYCVHPSHVEVVASLKNRDEILSFIFILISFLFFDKSFKQATLKKTIICIVIMLLSFYCAILSKLTALPFMACIFLWSLYAAYYKKWKIFVPILLCVFLVFVMHMIFFKDYYFQRIVTVSFFENPITYNTTLNMKLGLGFNSILFYLRFLIFPFPFRFYYGYNVIPYESISAPIPLLSLLICVFLTILLIYSTLKHHKYAYFLAATMFFLLFYSNIISPYTGIVSERSMYQFSFFFIVFILTFLFVRLLKNRKEKLNSDIKFRLKGLSVIFIIVIFFYSVLSISRSMDWKDELTLKLGDMKYLTNSRHANFITGFSCYTESFNLLTTDSILSKQYAGLALFYYNEFIKMDPEYEKGYFYLGNLYKYVLNDNKNAEINYKIAISKPHTISDNVYQELASLLFIQNRFKEAVPYYEKAVEESPENKELAFYKVLNLYNAQETQAFLHQNHLLEQKFPNDQYAYLNYATYYQNFNKIDSTIYYLEKAIQYGFENKDAISQIINYYKQRNNAEKVIFYEQLLKN